MSNVVALNKFLHRKNLAVCFLLLAQSKLGLVQQVPPGVAGWVNSSCGRVWPQSPERSKRRNQHTVSDSGQTASHAWGFMLMSVQLIFSGFGGQREVRVMADENEVKQVQEPVQEQQQQSAEQKPAEPPSPEVQVA